MAQQLNVFIENRPGRVKSVTQILDQNQINIRAFTLQDKGDYGLMKLIVDKPKEAQMGMANAGFACALRDIIAIAINDIPGMLNKLTSILVEHNINIADAFGFVVEPKVKAVYCMEIRDTLTRELKEAIEKQGFRILSDTDIYEL